MTPSSLLKKYWGFEQFRPAQKTAISHILNHKDVIALLPTGGGKSICFQIPALFLEGICLVISPLISLMHDQVESLNSKGIKAMLLEGTLSYRELQTQLDNCSYGPYKFLYLSPERLQNQLVQERLQQMNINLIAIDEAHCISEWGHDFRPAYRKLAFLRELKPHAPIIALTATATKQVLTDIQTNLSMNKAELVQQSFERKNICLLVHQSKHKNNDLLTFLQRNKGASIVYVRSRKLAVELAQYLSAHRLQTAAFHGGMQLEKKKQLLHDWKNEKIDIIIATTAFGMGIDKANVRNVLHYQLPDSMESYYQEIGRAGRDEQKAKALLLYNDKDLVSLKSQYLTTIPSPESIRHVYKKINAYFSIAYGEGMEDEYNFNFSKFCRSYGLNHQLTFHTLQLLDQLGVLRLINQHRQRIELRLRVSPPVLRSFLEKNQFYKPLIHGLLRRQGGVFGTKTSVNLFQLKTQTGLHEEQILSQLKKLKEQEIIELNIANQDTSIRFLVPREDQYTLNPLLFYLKAYRQNKVQKVEAMLQYVEHNTQCKTIQLLSYFGETKTKKCGHCSFCLRNRITPTK